MRTFFIRILQNTQSRNRLYIILNNHKHGTLFAGFFKQKFAVRKKSTTSKELLLTLFNVNRSINKLHYDEVRLLRLRGRRNNYSLKNLSPIMSLLGVLSSFLDFHITCLTFPGFILYKGIIYDCLPCVFHVPPFSFYLFGPFKLRSRNFGPLVPIT